MIEVRGCEEEMHDQLRSLDLVDTLRGLALRILPRSVFGKPSIADGAKVRARGRLLARGSSTHDREASGSNNHDNGTHGDPQDIHLWSSYRTTAGTGSSTVRSTGIVTMCKSEHRAATPKTTIERLTDSQ